MSRQNVELVRRLMEVYNERSFEQNGDLFDPDIVWDVSRVDAPDVASSTGRAELREFARDWEESFQSEHVAIQEIADGGDRVALSVRHRGRGTLSGAEVDQTFGMVWTLRDGRAVGMEMYPTYDEALEAVGLKGS